LGIHLLGFRLRNGDFFFKREGQMKSFSSQWIVITGLLILIGSLKWWDGQRQVLMVTAPEVENFDDTEQVEINQDETELLPSPIPTLAEGLMPESVAPTLAPTIIPNEDKISGILVWKYPASRIVEQTSVRLLLETAEAAQTVTTWYIDQAEKSEWQTRTKVTTRANEKVENRLVFSRESEEISISISQADASQLVTILVEFR
jgi:hypothetical protein